MSIIPSLLLGFFLVLTLVPAHAALQLSRTRVVVHETEGSATIQVQSADTRTLLLQAWVEEDAQDGGDALLAPTLPFITDPPVLRLEPGETRAIRVLLVHAPENLPAARESLYWLNVLEVPEMQAEAAVGADAAQIDMSVQSRLKLFYRPRALAQYALANLPASEQLQFALEATQLVIHNPAPLYQSLAALSVQFSDGTRLELDAPMLAPRTTLHLDLPSADGVSVHLDTLNEDGGLIHHVQAL